MKNRIWVFYMTSLLLFSCQNSSSDEERIAGNYGDKVKETKLVSLEKMVEELNQKDSFEGKIKGEIQEVCANKGCWMTISLPNGELMRVTFKDYGFFVPKNAKGYPVILDGVATKTTTDVATLRHYAEDAGKSREEIESITVPEEGYHFEAKGVLIKENV